MTMTFGGDLGGSCETAAAGRCPARDTAAIGTSRSGARSVTPRIRTQTGPEEQTLSPEDRSSGTW
jgi:hypothetical protein